MIYRPRWCRDETYSLQYSSASSHALNYLEELGNCLNYRAGTAELKKIQCLPLSSSFLGIDRPYTRIASNNQVLLTYFVLLHVS